MIFANSSPPHQKLEEAHDQKNSEMKGPRIWRVLKFLGYAGSILSILIIFTLSNLYIYGQIVRESKSMISELHSTNNISKLSDYNLPLSFFTYMPLEIMKSIPSIILKTKEDELEYFKIEGATKHTSLNSTILHLSRGHMLHLTPEEGRLSNFRHNLVCTWKFEGFDQFVEQIKDELTSEELEMIMEFVNMTDSEKYEVAKHFVRYGVTTVPEGEMLMRPVYYKDYPVTRPYIKENSSPRNLHETKDHKKSSKKDDESLKDKAWDKKMGIFEKISGKFIDKAIASGTGVVSFENEHMQNIIKDFLEAQSHV